MNPIVDGFCINPDSFLLDLILDGIDPFEGSIVVYRSSRTREYGSTKLRPMIVQGFDGDRYRGWQLTSQSHFDGGRGSRRVRVPGMPECGLRIESYSWSSTIQYVRRETVLGVAWAAPRAALAALAGGDPLLSSWAESVAGDIEAAGWYWPRYEQG